MMKDIKFSCDGLQLTATLHLPEVKRPPVVIGCHGLFSDRNSPKQIALARECNRNDLGFLRIDHRGCGDSQGEFHAVTSLEARCNDLIAAIELVKSRDDTADKVGLFGSSMGGAVCLAVAGSLGLAPIVTVAAPIMSRHITDSVETPQTPHHGAARFDVHKNSFDITQTLAGVSNILILHGAKDHVVPPDHAREIFHLAGEPKKLVIQKGGDHRMSDPSHQREFVREASLWFRNGLSE
ncbi:MAG: alpha/beta hydrolase [Deltaproteobacteria bacterium]|jgi:alpha-beta hydrolase superfamily lysophospholipase|nr:alpha/beta hydrolase [Deltaproteobacteria bacterium]